MGNFSALAHADFGAQTGSREESRSPILSDVSERKIEADGLGGRSMKTWLLFAALVSAPVAAQAESFTFTSTSKMLEEVYLPGPTADSRPMGGSVFSSSSKTVASDGKAYNTQGKCSSWVLPAGSQFGINGVCRFADGAAPLYELAYTCELPTKTSPSIDCWGKLIGSGGAWKGRTGTAAWRSNQDGSNQGSGQWN